MTATSQSEGCCLEKERDDFPNTVMDWICRLIGVCGGV
jgi:hypothetical protein